MHIAELFINGPRYVQKYSSEVPIEIAKSPCVLYKWLLAFRVY